MASKFRVVSFCLLLTAECLGATGEAAASKLRILHSFGLDLSEGVGPQGGVISDASGNLYGTTSSGGGGQGRGAGTVFELIGGKKFKTLYSFPHDESTGRAPSYSLILDVNGNLYGTTAAGGAHLRGTVFELSPPSNGAKAWTFHVLYNFCAQENCADGSSPSSGLTYAKASTGAPYDGSSPLYGETAAGGSGSIHGGTVYALSPGEQGWTEEVVHSFCSAGGNACTDGFFPRGGVLEDASGNLFGTAQNGGNSSNSGIAFELTQNGGPWTESLLYTFCSQHACKDGAEPTGSLVQDFSGNLYGTTISGGRAYNSAGLQGATCGVIFQLTPNGGAWQESVLYPFCTKQDCKDGAAPQAGLSLDAAGNLFGSTGFGGGHDIDQLGWGGGVVFRYANGAYTRLYSFCKQASCADGEYPFSGVIPDGSGNLLGTTSQGGPNGGGEVFRLFP